jgi:enamine deaminase RidA (YjgF/YER057c/UK114 family)
MPYRIVNPAALHDPSPFGYSHSAALAAGTGLVFVSGQYGSDAYGALVSPHFAPQLEQAFANLATVLAAHGLTPREVVQLRTYVVQPDAEKLGLIGQMVQAHCGPVPPTQTLIGVASLAMPGMWFEVEAVAAQA